MRNLIIELARWICCHIIAIILALPDKTNVHNRFVSIFPTGFNNNDGMCCQKKKKLALSKNSFLAFWVDLSVKMMNQLCKENQHLGGIFLYLSQQSVLPKCKLIKMPQVFPYQSSIALILRRKTNCRARCSESNIMKSVLKIMWATAFWHMCILQHW